MTDLIALRCPSCGGQIQVEGTLEKFFCTHCGTQLFLNKSADGMLTPMKARDLTASAKLKESQSTMLLAELLRSQIAELEGRTLRVRRSFFVACTKHKSAWDLRKFAYKLLKDFLKERGLSLDTFDFILDDDAEIDIDAMLSQERAGCTSADELFTIYEYLSAHSENDRAAREFVAVLEPISQIAPDLQKKKQQLEEVIEKTISGA